MPGIEGAIADNAEHNLSASDPGDLRTVQLRVAGPAALLVSKAYKLNERLADPNPDRLTTKDAFDSYRLLQLPMSQLLTGFERMASHEVAGPVAKQGVSLFTELFGRPDAVGVQLAGRYVEGVGEPEIVRLSVAALARELIASLSPI